MHFFITVFSTLRGGGEDVAVVHHLSLHALRYDVCQLFIGHSVVFFFCTLALDVAEESQRE